MTESKGVFIVAATTKEPGLYFCKYCGGYLDEIVSYVRAECASCGSAHGWDDVDADWYGL